MEVKDSARLFNGCLNIPLGLTAIIGNALVLGAIWKTPSLHCATNVLIFSLALSDLGVGLICQPSLIFRELSLATIGENTVSEKILHICSASLCGVSLFTVTLIGVDRYLAVNLHLRYKAFITPKKTTGICVAIWVGSLCIMTICFQALREPFPTFQILTSPIMISCLFTNIYVYQKLYRVCRFHHAKIQDQTAFQQDSSLYQRAINEARFRKSVKTMFFIVLAFTLCYFPFICLNVFRQTISAGYFFTITFVYLNSSVNPALLCFQLTEYRLAVKRILKQAFGRRQVNCQWFGCILNTKNHEMYACSLVENSLSKLFNLADFLDIIITILSYVPKGIVLWTKNSVFDCGRDPHTPVTRAWDNPETKGNVLGKRLALRLFCPTDMRRREQLLGYQIFSWDLFLVFYRKKNEVHQQLFGFVFIN